MNHIAASQLSQAKRFVISSSRLSVSVLPKTAETRQGRTARSRRVRRSGIALKGSFSGDGSVASYVDNIRTAKETTMNKGADDMSDHDEWISCSHWGMFPLERESLN